MDKLRLFGIAIIFLAALASPAFAGKTSFTADLKGSSEVPPTDSAATGKAEASYDDSTQDFNVDDYLFGSQRKGDGRSFSWAG